MQDIPRYATKAEAYAAVAARHGVEPDDLDVIPHPRDGVEASYLSYGPADEDVELVSWDSEE
jgi:hypothetical protein